MKVKEKKTHVKVSLMWLSIMLGVIATTVVILIFLPIKHKHQNRELVKFSETMKDFTVTFYCPNSCCNYLWAGKVCDGHSMEYYQKKGEHIVAVDPKVIKLGSAVSWNGSVYTARDVGSAIKGKKLDILVATHAEAIKKGKLHNQIIEVFKTN